jgi:hypothetical protein
MIQITLFRSAKNHLFHSYPLTLILQAQQPILMICSRQYARPTPHVFSLTITILQPFSTGPERLNPHPDDDLLPQRQPQAKVRITLPLKPKLHKSWFWKL